MKGRGRGGGGGRREKKRRNNSLGKSKKWRNRSCPRGQGGYWNTLNAPSA